MELLKLTSIRLEKRSLEQANRIAKEIGCFQTSNVIRTSLWVGLKIVTSRNCLRLGSLQFKEEVDGALYGLEDVLRTAAQNKEGAR